MLYHCTPTEINKFLTPRYSRLVDDKVVYATPSRTFAMLFIPQWDDLDFELCTVNNKLTLIENRPNNLKILKASGFIYHVNGDTFESHETS